MPGHDRGPNREREREAAALIAYLLCSHAALGPGTALTLEADWPQPLGVELMAVDSVRVAH